MLKSFSNILLVKNSLFHWALVFIGLFYLYFLKEYLTIVMSIFFILCLILGTIKVQAKTPLKIICILIICIHHAIYYGYSLSSESALNFILGMAGLKLLEQNNFRDRHLLLFIVFLLLNAALLFEKSLLVFAYVLISYLSLILMLNTSKWDWRYVLNAIKSALIVSPIILIAYLFFPRWNSQLFGDFSVADQSSAIQKIGLSMEVNFKNLSSLIPNSSLSFLAFVEEMQKPLYWRSHTLSQTDGWNWERSTSDSLFFKAGSFPEKKSEKLIQQKIQLENNQRNFIGLDRSFQFTLNNIIYIPDSYSLSYAFPQRSTIKSYEASSATASELKNLPLSSSDKKNLLVMPDINVSLPKLYFSNIFELQKSLREHFIQKQFSYSYDPGLITTVQDFLRIKKGFCTHFASYTALLLRANQIPTRLVSGYLGGKRSTLGQYYRVVENDAHVWVEAYYLDSWIRIDPTLWVASIRAQGGNEALMANNKNIFSFVFIDFYLEKHFPLIANSLNTLKYFSEKLNSDFQFWLENFNLNKQRDFAKQWQLSLNEFYLLGILFFIIAFALMAVWLLYRSQIHEKNIRWNKFQKFWKGASQKLPFSIQENEWGKLELLEKRLQDLNTPTAKKWLKKISRLKKILYPS